MNLKVTPKLSAHIRLVISIVSISILANAFAGCSPSHLATIKGPEAKHLVSTLKGTLLLAHGGDEIAAISLPSMKSYLVRRDKNTGSTFACVYSMSGPDKSNQIAYIEALTNTYQLKVLSLNGKHDRVVVTHKGFVFAQNVIGESIALSQVGSKVAFLSDTKDEQMQNPERLLTSAQIELWDVAKNKGRKLATYAMDSGISWFPDGRRLAYVALVSRKLVPNPGDFGSDFRSWPKLPVTCILDTTTQSTKMLAVGWNPVVSTDGKSVIVLDGDFRPRLVTVSSQACTPINIAGLCRTVIALDGNNAVYWGLNTTGMPLKTTTNYSPISGPHDMPSIKVAVPNTNTFQTIVPYVDTRLPISFGKGHL